MRYYKTIGITTLAGETVIIRISSLPTSVVLPDIINMSDILVCKNILEKVF
jgi:hypothetical protein